MASDPERYFLALLSAHIEIGKVREPTALSENSVIETFAAARYGKRVDDLAGGVQLTQKERSILTDRGRRKFDQIERRGADDLVAFDGPKRGRTDGKDWRSESAFRPIAENWRRKLHRIRTKPSHDPDWRWLRAMTLAWRTCLWGEVRHESSAESLASSAGEKEYFEANMRPVLAERAATFWSIQDPVNVRGVKDLLGQASFATTEKHYIMAQSRLAGLALAKALGGSRK